MFIEPLDPRRLMAATTGLDPGFGKAGQAAFLDGFLPGVPLITAGGAIFATGTIGRIPYVVKMTADGKADATFGDYGYARLPLRYDTLPDPEPENQGSDPSLIFSRLAYDDANGLVYVGTERRKVFGGGLTVGVTRLLPSGDVDPTYGDKGTFSYAPELPPGPAGPANATVEAINPLADGSVVLAVDRKTRAGTNTFTDQNLALIKLRPKGTRDVSYGKRGIRQLLGGTIGGLSYDAAVDDEVPTARRAFFSDVRTDRRGNTSVLMRYESGPLSSGFGLDDEPARGQFDIKARTVSAGGEIDPETAYTWKLFDSGSSTARSYHVKYAAPDGDAVRVVATADAPGEPPTAVYTLLRGHRARAQPISAVGLHAQFSVSRSANGSYVAHTNTEAARLTKDFTPDRTFADDGLATEGRTVWVYNQDSSGIADDRGRFLVFNAFARLERFA